LSIYRKKPVQYKRIGDKCYKENDYQGALYWYDAGLRKRPGNIKLLVCRANALFHLYYYDEAMESYFYAIKRKKKMSVIHRFINNYYRNFNDSIEKLALRLRERHGLNIEPNAVSLLVNYVQSRDANRAWYSQRNKFLDNFNKKALSCLEDYVDEYLWKYGIYDQYYFQWFYQVCQMNGFLLDQFELRNYIDSRKLFWESKSRGDSKISPLISAIDRMDGEEFENFIKEFFKKRGYEVSLTKKTIDWGGDLIIRGYTGTIVVQCKRWKEKVGVEAVQEAHTAKDLYKTQHAIVITNSFFSNEAEKMAATLGVELWDRTYLIREIIKDFYY
jgi:restriction system protein